MIVGIDLGTTNSSIAFYDGKESRIIPNQRGNRYTPSVVRFLDDGTVIVGESAANMLQIDPSHTLAGIKRFIGRRYNEVFDIARTAPYEVTIGDNNLATFVVRGQEYLPQTVSALILKSLKQSAEAYLGVPVKEALITVPAYFDEAQLKATREAGLIAGFDVKRILREPIAAALSYREIFKNRDIRLAVVDLGGGTFDVTILERASVDGECQFEVLSISGDGFLGGDDFDTYISAWIAAEIAQNHGVDVSKDALAWQRVIEVAKQTKHDLSSAQNALIRLPFLTVRNNPPISVELVLTQQKLEMVCEELFWRLRAPCHDALRASGLEPKEIDEVVLVGGTTRIPHCKAVFHDVFGRIPRTLINPQDAVALGAAVQAGVLGGKIKDFLLLDVAPHSIGIGDAEGRFVKLIERGSNIPLKTSHVFTTSINGQSSVEIQVVEGENSHIVDNRLLGRIVLDGIPPAPAGIPQIEITLDVDQNWSQRIVVKDKATGREQKMVIRTATGFSSDTLRILRDNLPDIQTT